MEDDELHCFFDRGEFKEGNEISHLAEPVWMTVLLWDGGRLVRKSSEIWHLLPLPIPGNQVQVVGLDHSAAGMCDRLKSGAAFRVARLYSEATL